jgi:hypothetical protein
VIAQFFLVLNNIPLSVSQLIHLKDILLLLSFDSKK